MTLIRLSTKLSLSMSTRFVRHMLRLPVGFFFQRFAGHLVARVALNDQVASLLSSQLATTILSLVSATVYAVAMLLIDPLLGAVAIALGAANVVALRAVSRRRRDVSVVLVSESGKLSAISFAGIQAIETIKASGSEDDFFARWSGQQAKVLNGRQDLGVATQVLSSFPVLLASLSAAAIVSLGRAPGARRGSVARVATCHPGARHLLHRPHPVARHARRDASGGGGEPHQPGRRPPLPTRRRERTERLPRTAPPG